MIYAFSRDGAIPGSQLWHKVNPRTRTPTNSIWLAVVGAFIIGLPYLWNLEAYAAVTSIATIGLYVAYVLPTFLRLRLGSRFQPGPWQLGRWSRPIGIISVAWVVIIVVLFMLPTASPITGKNFNYTAVAVVAVLGFAGIWWLVSARKWFKGPVRHGSEEELERIESDLDAPSLGRGLQDAGRQRQAPAREGAVGPDPADDVGHRLLHAQPGRFGHHDRLALGGQQPLVGI